MTMKNLLNFDIYAMVQPKTSADLVMILKEALSEIENINSALDDILAAEPTVAPQAA